MGGRRTLVFGVAARKRSPPRLVALLLLLYWALALSHLAVVPAVHEDEPWQASTGYKLATTGRFGSDMFAGFFNKDQRYYGFLPLHPLVLALFFRLFGLGLFQARLETVTLGLITLALAYALARRLFKSATVGTLAVLFLLFVRSSGITASQPTGILFFDVARIARYDMIVPVFGLASLHAFLSAQRLHSGARLLAAGFLAGLAGLGHLYGAFWLPALLVLASWHGVERARRAARQPGVRVAVRPALLLIAGFALAWLPYLAYVLTDLPDFRGQTRVYAYEGRFSVLSPGWYLGNLLAEPKRYGPGLREPWPLVLRPGLVAALVAVPLSLAALALRAARCRDAAARALAVPAIVLAVLFALLLRSKLASYLATLVPLYALAAAWGSERLWRRLRVHPARKWARTALALLFLGVLAEGSWRMAATQSLARRTTPYGDYIARVHRYIPPGARVLGLHNYWFGLSDTEYRAFWVPLRWTDPRLVPRPVPFDLALEQVAPDVVLLDARMRDYFASVATPEAPGHELLVGFTAWMDRHGARLAGRVEDPTYGTMEIYRMER